MRTGMMTVLVLVLAAAVSFGQEPYVYPATISSTGYGTASAEPDIVTIVFGVDITRSEPDLAVQDAGRLADAAMAAARAAGVAGSDMKTTGYNLWVEQVWDDYAYEYTGEMNYHVTHWMSADVRNIDDVGAVLAAIVEAGANSVSSVTFRVEDTTELYDLARQRAAEDARDKAELLVESFGTSLGRLTSISEWNSYNYAYDQAAYSNYGGGYGDYSVPPVTPGAYTVSVEVSASWELTE